MNVSPQYIEAATALGKERPSYAASVHDAHLASLGLSSKATGEIIERAAPEIADYLNRDEKARGRIAKLPDAEQVQEIAKLHEGMSERPGDNSDTDKYIESRTKKGPGIPRYVTTKGRKSERNDSRI
ncbi:MAG: hypothetical protein ACHQLQ_05140 [Candidatus Acidiferrales bacterium]